MGLLIRGTKVFLILLFCAQANGELSKQELVERIRKVAKVGGLDPDLAVAIATVESGLNPKAVGSIGEIGLFQLRPEYHRVYKGNPGHNMLVGVAYLVELKHRFGKQYPNSWFVFYNYGPSRTLKYPERTPYFKKVMRELSRLKVKRYLAVN